MAKTYSPKKVFVIYKGRPLTGYADGTFVTVERDEDTFTKTTGSDGEVARTQSANKGGKVTLTLMQSSAGNDYLSAEHAKDELTGLGTGPLIVKDASGRAIYTAAEAWITKPPSSEFSKELGSREWVFDCANLEVLVAGN